MSGEWGESARAIERFERSDFRPRVDEDERKMKEQFAKAGSPLGGLGGLELTRVGTEER